MTQILSSVVHYRNTLSRDNGEAGAQIEARLITEVRDSADARPVAVLRAVRED